MDSDFWTKAPYQNQTIEYAPIGKCLKKAQYGISIDMNEEDIGYPIYRMNEIHNMFCDIDVKKYAAVDWAEAKKFQLNDGDVVFNRTNSYEWVGRTGLYKQIGTQPFIFASYLVKFVPDERCVLPEFLTAFLNTSYGVQDIKRRSRQSINQTNVNPEEVKEMEIPLLKMPFQLLIKECFDDSHLARISSQTLYQQAERVLLEELGLVGFKPSTQGVSIKTFAQSFGTTGRLDAEYYQPKYDEMVQYLYTAPHKRLGELVNIQKSIEPGSEHYADEGMPFLRVSDLNKSGITEPNKKLSVAFCKENATLIQKLQPKKDTILFSKDGTVGIAHKLAEDKACITSGAVLHLTVKNEKEVLPDYLTLVLNSSVVQLQAERDAGGSIIQHWRVSEIEEVVIPVFSIEKQQAIAGLVQESFRLKTQSEALLEVAKRGVELAIETTEAQAQRWMQSQLEALD